MQRPSIGVYKVQQAFLNSCGLTARGFSFNSCVPREQKPTHREALRRVFNEKRVQVLQRGCRFRLKVSLVQRTLIIMYLGYV